MNETISHGGNLHRLAELAGRRPEELLDFSVNLNPAGPPPEAFEAYYAAFDTLDHYPDPAGETIAGRIADRIGCPAECVQPGNGSSELLALLPRAIPARRAVLPVPGYLEYEAACRNAGMEIIRFELKADNDFRIAPEEFSAALRPGDLAVFGNPANPTGTALPAATLRLLAENHPGVHFIIDEAFIDFLPPEYRLAFPLPPNLTVVRSLTKFHALPGLRMGYAAGAPETIARLRELLPCWSLGSVAEKVMELIFSERLDRYRTESLELTANLREKLAGELAKRPGIRVFPSLANYLLLHSNRPDLGTRLLRESGIALRDASNYPGLGACYFRVAVRNADDNARLLAGLDRLLCPPGPFLSERRPTPALMLQGTCSNAGKSVLAAAFCRIMLQDGIAVAPFKAQNMALNSFVTADGGEIGRAQAVQAEACRLEPDVRMNPILLKPQSDLGSQVILHGRPIGSMRVREYFARKAELWDEVRKSYRSLASDFEAVVLEGAGSPGEINLKSSDIVNMRMADYAKAQVLLVGDIDRGGVYASFLGTYATFDRRERKLLAGFLVNKFRGDPSLLGDAHESIRRFTGKPVLGVIDYFGDLGLPEEDSVNFSFIRPAPKFDRTLDLALLRLGHVANFTDFVPFELEPDVTVRKIASAEDFGNPDIVILPGSRSVGADLALLEQARLTGKIREAARRGATIVGICGGLQLLGDRLLDPDGLESETVEIRCLGLLPLNTTLKREKILRRTVGSRADGSRVSGYEIHHGVTECTAQETIRRMRADSGEEIGYECDNIFTSYLHGIFDDDVFRRRWLDEVRKRHGLAPLGGITAHYGTEKALNRLADHVRSRVDIPALYKRIGLR